MTAIARTIRAVFVDTPAKAPVSHRHIEPVVLATPLAWVVLNLVARVVG